MHPTRKSLFPLLAALAAPLAGCGTTTADRTVGGAGVGAGAGALLGAVTGLSVAQGALLGATAGALTGALASPSSVNLGEPPWRRQAAAGGAGAVHTETVTWIQARLNALGYRAGAVDGRAGPQTRAAIRAYQRDHGLLVDGSPTPTLADHMWKSGG